MARWFQSPGPLYEPQLEGADWRWGQALADLGVGGDDVVLNCFGYHLSPAGAMLEQGARSVGAAVVAGGIGNQDLQARAIADLGVTAYTGLPSYLKALLEAFDRLAADPYSAPVKPLRGRPEWRLRVGDWRALLRVDHEARTIVVVAIGPRGDIYKH